MHDVMRFWLKRGVDGFRVDVMWHLIKDAQFHDNPPNPDFRDGDQPLQTPAAALFHRPAGGARRHPRHARVIDEFPERVLIGEIYLPVEKLAAYYGRDLSGAHLPFNFSLIETPLRRDAIAALSRATKRRCRKAPGRTGSWAITTGRGSPPASGRRTRGLPPCCC